MIFDAAVERYSDYCCGADEQFPEGYEGWMPVAPAEPYKAKAVDF